jgi:anaerobic selenocysteine-containing dehydrogenase
LYDAGLAVSETLLRDLVREPVLRVSPQDLARLGVASGSIVRATSSKATLDLPIEVDTGVPAGVAALAFSADGRGAAELIEAGSAVTDLRVETVQ